MKTDMTPILSHRRIQRIILSGLAALTLAAPVLHAQTPSAPTQEAVDKRADLSIQRIELLFDSSSYDKTRAFVFVQNQGLTKSKPCTLTLQTTGALGSARSSAYVPALKPGAWVSVTVNTPIGAAEPGTNHHFTVDASNVVDEYNEFNNTYDLDNL